MAFAVTVGVRHVTTISSSVYQMIQRQMIALLVPCGLTKKGSMNLKIDIYDSDSGVNIYNHQTNEFVDTFSLNISIPATSHVSFAHPQNITLQAKPRGLEPGPKLTAQISVSCNTNYLIPSCLEYCVNTDATSRHYKCNYTTGVKRCMADWYGASCDLACLPRNDSLGHYNCLENGTKQCLPGWIDPEKNCTQASRGNMHSSSTSTPNIFSTTHIKTSISSNSIQATDSSIYKQIPLLFSTNADTTYPLSTAARMVTSSRRDDSPVSSMLPISSKMGGITGGLTSSTIVATSSVVQASLSTPNIKQSDPKISQTSTEIATNINNENSIIETFSSQLSPVGPTTELSKPPASNPPASNPPASNPAASNPPAIRTTASFTTVDDVSSQISTMHAFTVRSSSAMSRELLTASLVPTTTTQSNVNSTIVKGDQFKELPWLVLLIIPVLFTVIAIVHLHQLKKRRRSSRISPETAQRNSSKQMRRIKVKPVAAITKATKTTTL
eukprot:gene18734-20623_t